MLLEPRVVGRGLDGEVERDVDAVLRRRGAQRPHVVVRPELGMHRVMAARRVADRPRAAGVARAGHERVVAALAVGAARSGGRAAGRGRRSPARAAAAAAAARRARPPKERGNSSYHAPKRARSRSTSSWIGGSSVAAPCRAALRSIAANSSCPSAVSYFAAGGTSASSRRSSACSMIRLSPVSVARPAVSRSSTRPSLSSPERSSWPASSLRWNSSRQVANWSVQPCTVHVQRPMRSTTNEPSQRTPL